MLNECNRDPDSNSSHHGLTTFASMAGNIVLPPYRIIVLNQIRIIFVKLLDKGRYFLIT